MMLDAFDRLPDSAKRHLTANPGDRLFRQEDVTLGLFVVLVGAVNLERVGPNGERVVIHRARAGTSFAEASVFAERYHCDAVVVQSSECVRIDKTAILAAFADVSFAQAFSRQACRQIQAQRQLLEIVGISSATERVMAGIVAGLLDGSVVDFAALVHLSQEATYRALRRLVQDGRLLNPARGLYRLVETD